MKAKRAKEENNKKFKNTLRIIFLIIIIIAGGYFIYEYIYSEYEEKMIEDKGNQVQENIIEDNKDNLDNIVGEDNKIEEQYVSTDDIPKKIKEYNVIAKLEIPKISLITNVISETTSKALNVSVTKFWGASPNEIGNFCISGHNNKVTMFKNVKDLEINDEIIVTNMEGLQITYVIYDMYIVDPYDTACLSQETNGQREITLITCTKGGKSRIIVKARQK